MQLCSRLDGRKGINVFIKDVNSYNGEKFRSITSCLVRRGDMA